MFNTDILCQAKSGMGKTAVFVLSTLQQLSLAPADGATADASSIKVVVLSHTREMAFQVKNEYVRFSKYMEGAKIECVFGGSVKMEEDLARLKAGSPQVLVATPGRLKALVEKGGLKLSGVKHFVMDECDKLLESMDMRADVQKIFRACPAKKQVMMFTATLAPEMKVICRRFMHDVCFLLFLSDTGLTEQNKKQKKPLEIIVDNESKLTLHGLKQFYSTLLEAEKTKKVSKLLDDIDFNQAVVFVKSTRRADALTQLLEQQSFPVTTIHGGMDQAERLRRYTGFKNMEKRVMVATDVLGRGIDIERVNLVINYDMADSRASYLHRVGRAGRFGTKGVAITFISSKEDTDVLNDVQKSFEVSIDQLPETIDKALYMNNV
ncbi:ATP-dependent RNA helicase uap56 [Blastocladiella britannica]|nr:ATP-dependent RNA helicase uap56 [Blastocladiella britannica]